MSTGYWILFDPAQNTQSEKQSSEQMQFLLMKMKTKEINRYLIYNTTWDKWKKLKEYLTSDDSVFMNTFFDSSSGDVDDTAVSTVKMRAAEPEIQTKVKNSFSSVQLSEINIADLNKTNTSHDFGAENINEATKTNIDFKNLNSANSIGSTSASNNKNKIELLLIHPKGQMFRTPAHDISLSGSFCEKIVPAEFHQGEFDLVVINNLISDNALNRISLKAKVTLTSNSIYVQYTQLTEPQKNSLRSILDYYVRASNNKQA